MLPDIEYDERGLPTIPDSDYAELRVQNAIARNCSRNNFTREIIAMIGNYGGENIRLTPTIHARIFNCEIPVFNDYKEIHDEHSAVHSDVDMERAREIAGARDLTCAEYDELSTALLSNRADVSETDRIATQKYELRATYNKRDVDEIISPEFVLTYADVRVRTAFRNLSALCDVLMRNTGDIHAALSEMKRIEAQYLNNEDTGGEMREFDFPYVYETHHVAHLIIAQLGFASVMDRRVFAVSDIEARIAAIPHTARTKMYERISRSFKVAPLRGAPVDAQTFINVAKKILVDTYLITIVRAGDVYQLSLAKIFHIAPNGKLVCYIT
jgi:hypothetical protein